MPEYFNPHPHDLYLVGPNGDTIHIRKGRKIRLPEYFDRYVNKSGNRGYLIRVDHGQQVREIKHQKVVTRITRPANILQRATNNTKRPIVGKMKSNIDQSCSKSFTNRAYSISNGIGVGILTYNRSESLRRLVNSIIKNTDLCRTTLFISDDGSTNIDQLTYLSELELRDDIVVLRNKQQLGVAGNSNRLMRCLSRFPKKILLNDDVEILRTGWDNFYFSIMRQTGFHHFCHRQPGVYGAEKGSAVIVNNIRLNVVNDKPHGAIIALDDIAFVKVGYFDEQFGQYGIEHVDWSNRLSNSKLQQVGYFDAEGSDLYFSVHPDQSSVENRAGKFKQAKEILNTLGTRPTYVNTSDATIVPRISCVIPFREIGRKNSILTVLGNIRAQRYPDIEIIMTEEDSISKITDAECAPAKHIFTIGLPGAAFNKSKAWNVGVEFCTSDMLVLHDADTLVSCNYFCSIANELATVESCHLCKRIFYLNESETNNINTSGIICQPNYEHFVDYFEGGSIACRRNAYWRIGGFVEEYVGYGCEDCDFYFRLSRGTTWKENRCFDLLHLHHGRVDNWGQYHKKNKELERKLSEMQFVDRIAKQRQMLINNGYGHCLD
jgi:hypothetical protein